MNGHESSNVHMTVGEAAVFLKLSKSWLNKARLVGNGPCFIKAGRRVLYSTDDISIWIKARKHTSTSGYSG